MADKEPVVLGWMTISLGVIFVFAAIALVTFIDNAADLAIPPFILTPIGAAIGVAAWFALVFRRKSNGN